MTTLKRVQFQEEASEQEKEELVAETILNAMQNYFFYRLQNPGVMLYAVTGKEPAGVPHMNGFFNFKKNKMKFELHGNEMDCRAGIR